MKEAKIFESWIDNLAEGTWNLPETPEQLDKLKTMMAAELIVGPDAINATEQLYDLVGDDILFDRLSELAAKDPRANAWNDTEVMNRLAELGIEMPEPTEPGNPAEPATAPVAAAPAAPEPVAEDDELGEGIVDTVKQGVNKLTGYKVKVSPDDQVWIPGTTVGYYTPGGSNSRESEKVNLEKLSAELKKQGINTSEIRYTDGATNEKFTGDKYPAAWFIKVVKGQAQTVLDMLKNNKIPGFAAASPSLSYPSGRPPTYSHSQDGLGGNPKSESIEQGMTESTELNTMLKYAGIPVAESRVLDEAGETIDHILNRFKHEVGQFEQGNDLDSDLYDALFDYYSDKGEIPYGIAKARTGDPFTWVSDKLADHLGVNEGWKGAIAGGLAGGALGSVVPALGTLAGAAAGAYAGHKLGDEGFKDPDAEYKKAQKLKQQPPVDEADPISTFEVMSGFDAPVAEGSCNMTAEGAYCPEHGLMECGGMYESALSRLKSLAKIKEGWKGELAGGTVGGVGGSVAGSALGALAGGPVGAAIGGVVGGAAGGTAGQMAGRELTKEEQLDEIAPLVAAGARAVLPLLAKVGPALGRMASGAGKSGAAVAGKAATGIGRGTVDVAKSAAQSAAQNADKIGLGLGAYQAITDVANSTMGGVGEVYRDVGQAADAITQTVGNAIDGKTIAELAGTAVKYSIPIGILLAVLYGGKKLIDQVMAEGADDTVMGSLGKFAGSITPNTGDFAAGFEKTFEGDAMLARIKSLALIR